MFGTRKLGKTSAQRKALLRQQATDLLNYGKMETTFYRAKEVQPVVEKLITLVRRAACITIAEPCLSSPARMWQRSCLTRSFPSTLTVMAATPE